MPDHIQIGDKKPWEQYVVGETAQDIFPFHFPIFKGDDLEVYVDGVLQSAGYTVLGAGQSEGGTVVFDNAVANCIVTVRRWLTIERTSDFQESGEFRARVLNDELDYQVAAIQQVADDLTRVLRLGATDSATDFELPAKELRKGAFLAFDATTGDPIAVSGLAGVVVSAAMEAVVAAATAELARLALGLGSAAVRSVDETGGVQSYNTATLFADSAKALSVGFYNGSDHDYGEIAADGTLAIDLSTKAMAKASLPAAGSSSHTVAPDTSRLGGQSILLSSGAGGAYTLQANGFDKVFGVFEGGADKKHLLTGIMHEGFSVLYIEGVA